ncbi:hypothetical protein N7475_010284 [Penicillium sp. IBT 31633x]|nr:hypothetical protein N7475_010284 [Penicillium sp. IBT 31633x]
MEAPPNPADSWDAPGDAEGTSTEDRRKFQNRMAQRRFPRYDPMDRPTTRSPGVVYEQPNAITH